MRERTQNPHGSSVVWTRGRGCSELADLLADGEIHRLSGDLVEGCIANRADLLVAKRFPGSFDLVSVAVPIGFEPSHVGRIVATVAGGPHSLLAAETAARLGGALGVPAEMVSATPPGEDEEAGAVLERIGRYIPDLPGRVAVVGGVTELLEGMEEGTLLVMGAPGGSWIQRAMVGPGARLRSRAQAGVIMVRSAPERVFRWMGEPVYVGPLRLADDTLRLHGERVLAVADEGRLVGVVRRERLVAAGAQPVVSVMEEAVSVRVDETLEKARVLEETFGRDPIPVTDYEENLVGGLSLPAA